MPLSKKQKKSLVAEYLKQVGYSGKTNNLSKVFEAVFGDEMVVLASEPGRPIVPKWQKKLNALQSEGLDVNDYLLYKVALKLGLHQELEDGEEIDFLK